MSAGFPSRAPAAERTAVDAGSVDDHREAPGSRRQSPRQRLQQSYGTVDLRRGSPSTPSQSRPATSTLPGHNLPILSVVELLQQDPTSCYGQFSDASAVPPPLKIVKVRNPEQQSFSPFSNTRAVPAPLNISVSSISGWETVNSSPEDHVKPRRTAARQEQNLTSETLPPLPRLPDLQHYRRLFSQDQQPEIDYDSDSERASLEDIQHYVRRPRVDQPRPAQPLVEQSGVKHPELERQTHARYNQPESSIEPVVRRRNVGRPHPTDEQQVTDTTPTKHFRRRETADQTSISSELRVATPQLSDAYRVTVPTAEITESTHRRLDDRWEQYLDARRNNSTGLDSWEEHCQLLPGQGRLGTLNQSVDPQHSNSHRHTSSLQRSHNTKSSPFALELPKSSKHSPKPHPALPQRRRTLKKKSSRGLELGISLEQPKQSPQRQEKQEPLPLAPNFPATTEKTHNPLRRRDILKKKLSIGQKLPTSTDQQTSARPSLFKRVRDKLTTPLPWSKPEEEPLYSIVQGEEILSDSSDSTSTCSPDRRAESRISDNPPAIGALSFEKYRPVLSNEQISGRSTFVRTVHDYNHRPVTRRGPITKAPARLESPRTPQYLSPNTKSTPPADAFNYQTPTTNSLITATVSENSRTSEHDRIPPSTSFPDPITTVTEAIDELLNDEDENMPPRRTNNKKDKAEDKHPQKPAPKKLVRSKGYTDLQKVLKPKEPQLSRADKKLQDESWIFSSKSKLGDSDLNAYFQQTSAWDCLGDEEKAQITSLLPINTPFDESGRPSKDFLKYNNDWRDGLRQFKEDLLSGRYEPEWLAEANLAMQERAAGHFDEAKEDEMEEFWGQKTILSTREFDSEAASVRLGEMLAGRALQIGDVISYSRPYGTGKRGILVEKEVKIVGERQDGSLVVAIPPSQFKYEVPRRELPAVPASSLPGAVNSNSTPSNAAQVARPLRQRCPIPSLPTSRALGAEFGYLKPMLSTSESRPAALFSMPSVAAHSSPLKRKADAMKSPSPEDMPQELPQTPEPLGDERSTEHDITTLTQLEELIVAIDGRAVGKKALGGKAGLWKSFFVRRGEKELGTLWDMRRDFYLKQNPDVRVKSPGFAR